jgi:hypothetical protein
VLRETTSRGLWGLVCPSCTSERRGEGDCVNEGGGGEGERERERALRQAQALGGCNRTASTRTCRYPSHAHP